MPYDYFYNGEAEQYLHYTLPKLFFKDMDGSANGYNEELIGLSLNAKFLYAILLNKARLSDKNGFTDEDGKVCVYYPQAKMAKLLHVERKQLYKYLNELDDKNGIGLIERKQKLGKGRTDCIYVKNFAKPVGNGTSTETSATKYKYFCDDDTVSAARFKFYSLPQTLFYDVDYAEKNGYPDEILELQELPSNAKMAYTYFLDLLQLSISKGKKDEYGRYYVICPEEDLQKLLGCCIKTVRQTLNQLDIKSGVGLIERSSDNPAIIYVLDYSVRLSLNSKPKSKKSTHQQSEKSTHQKEKSTHQKEKSTHQKEKSTHPIYNNPYINNPDFSDTHSINQSSACADGMNDGHQNIKKKLSFSEMLKAIDYHDDYSDYIPEDELYFGNAEESERNIDHCTLPYWLTKNPQAMREALKFVFSYSCYDKESDKEIRILLDTVIKLLGKMTEKEYCILDGQMVKYYQIIDVINDIMHNSSLTEWLYSFKDEWSRILSENDIKRPEAYIKTCIWNSLSNFQFKNNNDALQGQYDCNHGFPNCRNNDGNDKSSFNPDMYDIFVNNFDLLKKEI